MKDNTLIKKLKALKPDGGPGYPSDIASVYDQGYLDAKWDAIKVVEREDEVLQAFAKAVQGPQPPAVSLEEHHRVLGEKQAVIDRLMLEFCPEEMTEDQISSWETNQRPVQEQ